MELWRGCQLGGKTSALGTLLSNPALTFDSQLRNSIRMAYHIETLIK